MTIQTLNKQRFRDTLVSMVEPTPVTDLPETPLLSTVRYETLVIRECQLEPDDIRRYRVFQFTHRKRSWLAALYSIPSVFDLGEARWEREGLHPQYVHGKGSCSLAALIAQAQRTQTPDSRPYGIALAGMFPDYPLINNLNMEMETWIDEYETQDKAMNALITHVEKTVWGSIKKGASKTP